MIVVDRGDCLWYVIPSSGRVAQNFRDAAAEAVMSRIASTTKTLRNSLLLLLLVHCAVAGQLAKTVEPLVRQESVAPFWTAEPGWTSELQLRNNAFKMDLTVTPVLRTWKGTEIPLPPVSLHPAEDYTIEIPSALAVVAPELANKPDAWGSIALNYTAPNWHYLYAAVMVREEGHAIAFHMDASHEDRSQTSGAHEGVWWLPRPTVTGFLIVVNQGSSVLNSILTMYDAKGRSVSQTIQLAPKQALRYKIPELISRSHLKGTFGAIRVSASYRAGGLDAAEILFDESSDFSALMKMFDHDPRALVRDRDYAGTGQWTTRAPMLALTSPDPALGFPVDTKLIPRIFLHNTTSHVLQASLKFNWRSENSTGTAPGPVIRLLPYETRLLDVASLQNGRVIPIEAHWTSVRIITDAMPDDLIAVATSFTPSGRYGTQTPFNDQLTFAWKGGQWQVDGTHNSIITAGNGGTKPIRALFTLYYDKGMKAYELERTLAADEQMWVDVGKLIRNAVPDRQGNVLPPDLTHGSYEIRDLTTQNIGSIFEGKVILDSKYGHVAYGCAGCCGYTTPWMDPNPLDLSVGSTFGEQVSSSECGRQVNVTNFTYSWQSDNTSIATVKNNQVHAVSPGMTGFGTGVSLAQPSNKSPCPTNDYNPYASELSYTSIQHSYPNNPLPTACWISQFFDHVTPRGTPHNAEDVIKSTGSGGTALPAGTPVYASEGGTVAKTATGNPAASYPSCTTANPHPQPNFVKIKGSDGYFTIYAHVTPQVSNGATVQAGQQIGVTDKSGCQSAGHVHMSRKDPSGNPVNFTIPCVNPIPTTSFSDGVIVDNDEPLF